MTDGWEPEDGAGYMPTEGRETQEAVPIGELEELIQAYRVGAKMSTPALDNGRKKGREETFETCADELKTIVEAHRDD